MKPTDPVAAPLLPCPFCKGTNCEVQSEIDIDGSWANVFCCVCRIHGPTVEGDKLKSVLDIVPTKAKLEQEAIVLWNQRTPLPPRADWALEAAWEIEADQQFGRMELQRIKDRAAIIAKHAPAAPDAQDGERLDWIEKTVTGKGLSPFLKSVFISHDYNGDIQVDVKTETVCIAPTLRAALDEARGQKE